MLYVSCENILTKHRSVCNIPHKCKDTDSAETLAKANKMFYE